MSKVIVSPEGSAEYSRIEFHDREGVPMVVQSCHRWTAVKEGKQYHHSHWSFYTKTEEG